MKKRRLLSIVLSLCMVLALMPQMVFAEGGGTTGAGLKYTISDDGKVTITGYEGSGSSVFIPEKIEGYDVTAIDIEDIGSTSNVTNISIPSSVTFIRSSSFGEWENLKEITVSENNLHYSSNDGVLFNKDKTILLLCPRGYTDNSYVIPNSVASIGQYAFSKCKKLKNITIPDKVTSIGNGAFSECLSLESITIPDGVTSIGNKAFYYCVVLKSITIPDSVTSIGQYAFYDCDGLESIDIPDGVTSIENGTFYKCKKLASVNIPNDVTSIGNWAFEYCESLKSIEIPSSVTSIGTNAFDGCTSLESIFLPDGLDASEAKIPDTTTKVRYSLDTSKGEVTITGITLGTDKSSVAIPATICGYPVVAVVASEQYKVGSHICKIGTACIAKASCSLCGKSDDDCFFFKNTIGWDEVYVYWRGGETACPAFPGIMATPVAERNDYYYVEIPVDATSLCFNNGKRMGEGTQQTEYITGDNLSTGNIFIPDPESSYEKTGGLWFRGECEKYVNPYGHKYTKEIISNETIQSEGTCKTETVYYYSCAYCDSVEKDDNHTFMGAKDSGKHTGVKVWEQNETQHKQYWDCCDAVVIDYEDHTWKNGECTKCNYICEHNDTDKDHECDFCGETLSQQSGGTSDDSNNDNDSKATDEDSAKTGDDANLALWLALMLLSGAGITGAAVYTRRKRTNE